MITEPFSVALFKEFDKRKYQYSVIDEHTKIYQIDTGNVKFLVFANGSSTYLDSFTGISISQSKYTTNVFLKENNYPHTKQILVNSILSLDNCLSQMGYPLVLKPISHDNGRGVFCNLTSKDDVMFFLNENKPFYMSGIILEKQEVGNDYRIMLMGNKFAFAIKRTPPSIVGDGVSTVKELIRIQNQKLKDKCDENQVQKTIPIDSELKMILKKNNIAMESVIAKEEIIQLKSISNLSVGGDRELIDESEIHPQVIEMCETISKRLNMFSVGIDYITKDISKPPEIYKDAIIEINNSPQLGAVWAPMFIDRLIDVVSNK
jgi:cyanophycin synthetase